MEEKKSYIIVTSDNKWESILYNATYDELIEDIEEVRLRIGNDVEIYVYPIENKVLTFK